MIFNLVDSATEDLGSGPVTVTFLYYSTKDGYYKTVEKHCASGGSVTAPADVGNVASTIGDTSVLFQDQHPALTFQEWTTTALTGLTGDIAVGAIYVTADGKSYASVRISAATGLSTTLNLTTLSAGTMTVYWGDGNNNTNTNVGNISMAHTYATGGDYWITLERNTGTYTFGQTTGTAFIGSGLLNVFVGINVIKIGAYAFYNTYTLRSITIPNTVLTIDTYAFNTCKSINSIFNKITSDTIPGYTYHYCYALRYLFIKDGIQIIGTSAFAACYGLESVNMPSTITLISSGVFSYDSAIKEIIINATSVPTLSNISAFDGIPTLFRIYVPDASVSAYKVATNWATYANNIYGISSRV